MKESYVNTALMTYSDRIPSNRIPIFRDALQDADDSSYHTMVVAKTYNVVVTVLLSIFLGTLGVDRFYLGDKGRGAGKLLLFILATGLMIGSLISIVVSFPGHMYNYHATTYGAATPGIFMILGLVAYAVVAIWSFVDIFVCIARAKEKSFQNLMRAL